MYAHILVPVNGSPTSDAGLLEAIGLARMSGGEILLLHISDGLPDIAESAACGVYVPDLTKSAMERGAALLESCRARVAQAGVAVDSLNIEGDGRHLEAFIADQVEAGNADVIVLGTHGRRGVSRMLLGSDAEQVVRKATVPVLLVRHPSSNAASTAEPSAAGVSDTLTA